MKIPRDLSASELINALIKIGYSITRQKGSHIRLTSILNSEEHHITIPNHSPIKIGTLNNRFPFLNFPKIFQTNWQNK